MESKTWYQRTHLQGSNGDADTQKRPVDPGQVRESGTNGEGSTEKYTLPYAQQMPVGICQGTQTGVL